MRKHVWASKANKEDAELLAKWLLETPNNLFDPAIVTYPTTQTWKAENGKTLMFLPFQLTITLESLAISPENEAQDTAQALKSLIQAVRIEADRLGIKEINFVCKDESTLKFAQYHGFEQLTVQQCSCGETVKGTHLLRMKL